MSLRQLMPSLGEELDNLWARINHLGARVNDLEALSGVGLPSRSLGSLSAGPTCADPRHQWIRTWERSKGDNAVYRRDDLGTINRSYGNTYVGSPLVSYGGFTGEQGRYKRGASGPGRGGGDWRQSDLGDASLRRYQDLPSPPHHHENPRPPSCPLNIPRSPPSHHYQHGSSPRRRHKHRSTSIPPRFLKQGGGSPPRYFHQHESATRNCNRNRSSSPPRRQIGSRQTLIPPPFDRPLNQPSTITSLCYSNPPAFFPRKLIPTDRTLPGPVPFTQSRPGKALLSQVDRMPASKSLGDNCMKQEINGKKSTSPLSNANPDCSSSSPEHHSQHGPCLQPRFHNQGGSQVPNTYDSEPEYFSNNFWREPIIELTPTVIDQQLSGKSGNEETIGVKAVVSKERKENQMGRQLKETLDKNHERKSADDVSTKKCKPGDTAMQHGAGETIKYSPKICYIDKLVNGVTKTTCNLRGKMHNITCMDEYSSISQEELRWEEYNLGRRVQPPQTPTKLNLKKSAAAVDRKTTSSIGEAGSQAPALEDDDPRLYSPTLCNIDRVIDGVLKTDVNKGKLHNITCMTKYENKSQEELRWGRYEFWSQSKIRPSGDGQINHSRATEDREALVNMGRQNQAAQKELSSTQSDEKTNLALDEAESLVLAGKVGGNENLSAFLRKGGAVAERRNSTTSDAPKALEERAEELEEKNDDNVSEGRPIGGGRGDSVKSNDLTKSLRQETPTVSVEVSREAGMISLKPKLKRKVLK